MNGDYPRRIGIRMALPETVNKFLQTPSEEFLRQVHLKQLGYDQLENLLVALQEKFETNETLKILYLKCLTRIAKLDKQRGNYDKAEAHLNKTLEIDPNDVVARYLLIDVLRQTGKTNRAEQLIYGFIQSLPAHSQLKFLILCAFYQLHPEHELWPTLEQAAGIAKSAVENIAKDRKKINLLMLNYYQNSLWARTYSSLPINTLAMHGISDIIEVKKAFSKAPKPQHGKIKIKKPGQK